MSVRTEPARCTGCYDCQRAAGYTPKRPDILGQRHAEDDGRYIRKQVRTMDAEGRESTEVVDQRDSTAPSVRLRLIGPVNIGNRKR